LIGEENASYLKTFPEALTVSNHRSPQLVPRPRRATTPVIDRLSLIVGMPARMEQGKRKKSNL